MTPWLRLFEDILSDAARLHLPAPLPRMVFVVHGSMSINGSTFNHGEPWYGDGAAELVAGTEGVTCWRFELCPDAERGSGSPAHGVVSEQKLSAALDTLPRGELLLRGDSVAFPPGGCAYLHSHQGPGIRVLLEGGIRIDTHGRSTSYGPEAPGTRPDPIRFLRKLPPTGRAALFA